MSEKKCNIKNIFEKVKSKYILKKIFEFLREKILLKVIKYNKFI